MYLIKKSFQNVKLEFRRVSECRILHHLPQSFWGLEQPQTPGRTSTALCAVDQPPSRVNYVEGPLHVVEGYQVKKLRDPAGYLLFLISTPGVIPMVINIFVHNRQVLALQRINMNGCQTLGFDIRLSHRSCCHLGFDIRLSHRSCCHLGFDIRLSHRSCCHLGFDTRLSHRSCCHLGFGFGRFDSVPVIVQIVILKE